MHLIYQDVLDTIEKNSTIQKHPMMIEDTIECMLDHLKVCDHKEFEKILMKLHKIAYEGRFSYNLALYAVKCMENSDPKHPKGEFWSMHEIEAIAKQYGLPYSEADLPCTYFVMHMIRSDFYNPSLTEDEVEYYAHLAKNWINDKDVANPSGKAFSYWYHIVKGY